MEKRSLLDRLEEYFERLKNPQTEDDYYCLLVFWIHHAVFYASDNQRVLPCERKLGIFDSNTEVDFSEVENNLPQEIIDHIDSVVKVIMEKFSVDHPSANAVSADKKWFRAWWEEISGKSGRPKPYPEFVFCKIKL